MALKLAWSNDYEQYEVTEQLISRLEQLLQLAGEAEQVTDGEVALTFVSNEDIQELNKQYRGLDKPTDVLSFSMLDVTEDEIEILFGGDELEDEDGDIGDNKGPEYEAEQTDSEDAGEEEETYEEPLGDIVISVPKAVEQAEEYGHSLERELGFLFVHGFLHLIGYDHETEEQEKEMFSKQEQILEKAGLRR